MTGGVEEAAVFQAPVVDDFERGSGEVVALFGAEFAGGDEVGFAELAEMLGDGWLGHGEAGSELFDGLIGGGEQGEDLAARGMGDGFEERVCGVQPGDCGVCGGHKRMLMPQCHKILLMTRVMRWSAEG